MIRPALSEDWLVVLDRREACVFRSTAPGSVSQCIRFRGIGGGNGSESALTPDRIDQERTNSPSCFEPLAGVLRGADRILLFGRVTPLGDETGPFTFWLCNQYPELASRIVASVPIEPDEMIESNLLARARGCYERWVRMAAPPSDSARRRTDRRKTT